MEKVEMREKILVIDDDLEMGDMVSESPQPEKVLKGAESLRRKSSMS
jgi:hypothetical protein